MLDRAVGVIGLGGLGSAAAYWLARRGVDVVGFEQFELGHVRGASHDHSRIIRRSYHTPGYVELSAGAYDAWAAVERESGESIITRTGGIDLFPAGRHDRSVVVHVEPRRRRRAVRVDRRRRGAPAVAGVRGRRSRRRVRAWRSTHRTPASCPPVGAPRILQRLARERGADLRPNTPVRSIRPVGGEVDVVTDAGAVRCGSVIVTADAWTNRLLAPLGHALPLVVLREQVSYFPTADLGAVRAWAVPGVDLDGRSVLLRLPGVRRHDRRQGGRGLRRTRGRRRHAHVRSRSRHGSAARRLHARPRRRPLAAGRARRPACTR